jgi:hypothetical protein
MPGAGGHPTKLLNGAAEAVRAANHASITARDVLNSGLLTGADAYDAAGALSLLASHLPQLCRQLADVLVDAGGNGTLTGPQGAPELAAAELRQAAAAITAAARTLDAAWQALGPVGGWLSTAAQALASELAGEGGDADA